MVNVPLQGTACDNSPLRRFQLAGPDALPGPDTTAEEEEEEEEEEEQANFRIL